MIIITIGTCVGFDYSSDERYGVVIGRMMSGWNIGLFFRSVK